MSEVTNLKAVEKELELNDGTKIKLVINFGLLYQLRAKRKDIYEAYSKTILMGSQDLFDIVHVLYTAYLCANINDIDSCMTFDKFIKKIPEDMKLIAEICAELTQPKKK